MRMLREDYGDIVKMDRIVNRRTTIFLFSADYAQTMYRKQGVWPLRIAMDTLNCYKENREALYEGNQGLTTSQGKDWHDFRSKVNQHMMQPRAVKPHLHQINAATDDLILKIKALRNRDTLELPGTFNNELNKWALESICSIALDYKLGCLKPDLPKDSEPQKVINCVHEMFDLMYKLELQPSLWKVYPTSNLKRLFAVLDTLNGITIKYINQAKERYKNNDGDAEGNHNRSILEKLLAVDERVAKVMSLDMLTAGVDTTGNTSGALLYYLATNPEKQEKLRREAESLLPRKDSPIGPETLSNAAYAKACIKETLRLFPLAIGILRTMQQDVEIDGYVVRKGEDAIGCHSLMSRDPAHFPNPDAFIPERWIREASEFPSAKTAHPFAYMPFGFGPRTCIGRRFAEVELEILVLRVIRNFHLEWHKSALKAKSTFINTVATPLELKVVEV